MVAAFDYCLHGKGGAAPSIDTAMHGLVDAAHVDHLHPDSGIAIATAADGEELTKEIFGDQVVWVPWRRPGLPARPRHRRDQGAEPAGDRLHPRRPRHHRLGRHQRGVPRRNSLWIIDTAAAYIAEHGKAEPFGAAAGAGTPRCRTPSAGPRPPRWPPTIRGHRLDRTGRWSATSPTPTWSSTSWPPPSTRGWPSSARRAPTTSCAPRSSRWSSTCPRPRRVEESIARLRELHAAYREDYQAYYDRNATPDVPGDPRRRPADRAGPRRRDVLLRQGQADRPGRRRVLRQRDQRDARRRGPLDVRPDRRVGEVPHRVLGAGGGQAPADAEAQAAGHPDRPGDRRGVRASARRSPQRLAAEGACVVIADLDAREGAGRGRRDRRPRRRRSACSRRQRRGRRAGDGRRGRARLRRARPGGQQRRAVAVQVAARDHRGRLGPPARRDGQGLVPGLARPRRRC